jgi:putative glutamine amidotransferase
MSAGEDHKPRVGVPYRTKKEELAGDGRQIEPYLRAVRASGGEPVAISLALPPAEIERLAGSLDALLLTGSPADVDPSLFHQPRHPECADGDPSRERADFFLLDHAFRQKKPVLGICFGIQSLNVFLGGSLVQDIASELHSPIQHDWDQEQGAPEPFHGARIEPGSRLAEMAGGAGEARVNSSHHQAILDPGRNLRVVARAPDGVIEAVEMAGDSAWVMGVQWHPERMAETDSLARTLFRELVAAARQAPTRA